MVIHFRSFVLMAIMEEKKHSMIVFEITER